jgi:PEP-CTERM motif
MTLSTKFFAALALSTSLFAAMPAQAAVITTDANTGALAGVTLTPPFGGLTQAVGATSIATGIDFSWGNVEGIFSDPPRALCGINSAGRCDLVTDVDGRIVQLGTLLQGLTSYLYAEAGFSAAGSLTLSAFGIGNNLLASALNVGPAGTYGATTFAITRTTADIAYFRISGNDSYGVRQIRIETPIAVAAAVPEPATWMMLLAGFGLAGAALRRRRESVRVTFAQ